ncbi:HD domain-containing protein [Poseidonibacter antarcticus]|uniref:HD domain-containing protein n=1 Tax=Poseidonibacter antarcticus TaxID=2478538 RepID=UPI000EF4D1D4|nr:HD domain-containing protein [Poseidonibacter antarcticus]
MRLKRIFRKEFFITLFVKQNNWHKYSVFNHTLALVVHTIKHKQYRMIPAAFLHDIGKPVIAYQDEKDKITGEYSFHNHEELSYQIIKNWKISSYTKNLVRYHYLIRGMSKAKQKNQLGKYKRMKRSYDSLDKTFTKELKLFMKFDDLAKKSF